MGRIQIKMIQQTKWGLAVTPVETQQGNINYYDWLVNERDRINAVEDRYAEIRIQGKFYSLYVNNVGKSYKEREK